MGYGDLCIQCKLSGNFIIFLLKRVQTFMPKFFEPLSFTTTQKTYDFISFLYAKMLVFESIMACIAQ